MKSEGISPKPKRTFKFIQMRLQDRGYSDTVTTAWGPLIIGVTMPEVVGKLQACGEKLTEWCKNSFGSVRKTLEEKRVLLSEAKLDAAIGGVSQLAKSLQKEMKFSTRKAKCGNSDLGLSS